ncbi:MAG: hypothetical protein H7A29_06555 [Thermotogae bacterium]|nr:hypothetical protein [Thermotogota bacterium]
MSRETEESHYHLLATIRLDQYCYFAYDEIKLISQSSKSRESILEEQDDPFLPEDFVVLYYFHGTIRCKVCLDMEANAKKAVETHFSSQYGTGTLRWKW